MKKLMFVVLFASLLMAGYADTTASLTITAIVDGVASITVPPTWEVHLANEAGEVTTISFGNAFVKYNKKWKLEVSSANAGYFHNAIEDIPYTISIGDIVTDQSLDTPYLSAVQHKTKRVGNEYAIVLKTVASGEDYWEEGTYLDTITFTLVAQ